MTPDQLAQLLDELGQRLGPTGEYVFRLAVQRVVVESVINVIAGLVLATGIAVYWIVVALDVRRFSRKPSDEQAYGYGRRNVETWFDSRGLPLVVVGGIVSGCLALLVIGLLVTSVTSLLTPEYTALTDLLRKVK